MKPPQTEDEERAALAYEAGWLSGRVMKETGHFPSALVAVIERYGGVDLRPMSTREIGELCAAIRAEHPDAGEPFERNS